MHDLGVTGSSGRLVLALGAATVVVSGLVLGALLRGTTGGFVLLHIVHASIYLSAVVLILRPKRVRVGASSLGGTRAGADGEVFERTAGSKAGAAHVLGIIVAVAILIRLIALAAPPTLTTDAFRYVWDGRVQAAGINPYLHIPAAPELAHLRDQVIFPNINRADVYPTIYPPVAEMLFYLGTRISDGIRGLQILMLALDLVAIWALVRWLSALGLPRERVLIYAWHPLPLWELTGMAHIDGAAIAFLCLALVAAQSGRQGVVGAMCAAAGLVKYQYVLLAPALWRRWDWRLPAAMCAVILACYLPYLPAGAKLLGSLFAHLAEEGYRDGYGFYLVGAPKHFGLPHLSSRVFAAVVAVVLAALAAAIAWRRQPGSIEPSHGLWLIGAFLVLVSPHYPWYYALAIPLLTARMSLPLLWMTLVVSGVYLEAPDGPLEPFTRIKVFTAMFAGAALLAALQWWWVRSSARTT